MPTLSSYEDAATLLSHRLCCCGTKLRLARKSCIHILTSEKSCRRAYFSNPLGAYPVMCGEIDAAPAGAVTD